MPLRRTPPSLLPVSPAISDSENVCLDKPTITLSGSAPNLSSSDVGNITTRIKRKREDDLSTFMQEIRNLLQASAAQNDSKFLLLQNSMTEIIAQNTEINKNLAFVSQQYDDLKRNMDKLQKERNTDRTYINQLEEKIENLERTLCLTKMEIRNIPKIENENKEDLCRIVTQTAGVLDITLERQDIKDVFRINKKDGNPSIIVDFVSVSTKEKLLHGVRHFNRKNNQSKLNTTLINIKGETKPIYLSESLTMKAQRLFYLARKFASENGFKFCWTSLGKVFLRQSEGKKHILVKSETDLKINIEQ